MSSHTYTDILEKHFGPYETWPLSFQYHEQMQRPQYGPLDDEMLQHQYAIVYWLATTWYPPPDILEHHRESLVSLRDKVVEAGHELKELLTAMGVPLLRSQE